jgi:hypothetical protein
VKRVTLDSNIYLSALVFGGKPKRILEMAIEGEIGASDAFASDLKSAGRSPQMLAVFVAMRQIARAL